MSDSDAVDFKTCHENRRDCEGPKWKDKGFWPGKALITILLVIAAALAALGGMGISNSVGFAAHMEEGKRSEVRLEKRFEGMDKKLDKLLKLNGHNPRER